MTNQLNLFPADSPANHILTPESKEAGKMTVTSGKNISGLYNRSDPVGLLAKMFLESSIWNSTKCFLTWRARITPANRLLFQLVPSTPHIEGIESGSSQDEMLWATPNTMDHLPQRSPEALHRLATTHRKGRTRPSNLREQVDEATLKMWPTPNASDNRDRGNLSDPAIQRRILLGKQVGLTMAVKDGKEIGTLNPNWVEWLMGYPIGWTDLKD